MDGAATADAPGHDRNHQDRSPSPDLPPSSPISVEHAEMKRAEKTEMLREDLEAIQDHDLVPTDKQERERLEASFEESAIGNGVLHSNVSPDSENGHVSQSENTHMVEAKSRQRGSAENGVGIQRNGLLDGNGLSPEEHTVSPYEEGDPLDDRAVSPEEHVVSPYDREATLSARSSQSSLASLRSHGSDASFAPSEIRMEQQSALPGYLRSDERPPVDSMEEELQDQHTGVPSLSIQTEDSPDSPLDRQYEGLTETSRLPEDNSAFISVGVISAAATFEENIPARHIRRAQQNLSPRGPDTPTQESRKSLGILRQFSYASHDRNVRYSWQSVHDKEPTKPRIHIVKLVSNTTSASAGFPGGEALQFSLSPGGRRIAAYNSARLYILHSAALPVGISQDYALKRRPLMVEVVDDGKTLAILVDPHTVNVYDLGHEELQRIRTLKLDFPTNCIALSPTGGLIATAYEGGVEIFSLSPSALPTDRRAVRSLRIDRMEFSEDSSTLLGTTTRINASSTLIVSVPVFPAAANGVPTHDELKEAWCSELLQPENVRNSSHATFMREDRKTSNEHLFAWNGLADTFGLLNLSDLQYGNVDFPVIISPPLSTCGGLGAAIHSCPSIDESGTTVALVVNDRTVRLYIVPKPEDDETAVEAHSIDHELDEWYGNAFTEVRWVRSSSALPAPLDDQLQTQGRLIVASPGGVMEANTSLGLGLTEESIDDIEGGRIILFDFDSQFVGQEGQTFSLTLGSAKPQLLQEAVFDAAEEVALVRRRTVNQKKGGDMIHRPVVLGRSATTFGGRRRGGRAGGTMLPLRREVDPNRSLPNVVEDVEALDALEQPYQPGAPRSSASLQRAATNVQRHRFQVLEERSRAGVPFDTGDLMPLPEYTEEPNAPLPSRYRTLAGLDQPAPPPMNVKSESSTSSSTRRPGTTPSEPQQQETVTTDTQRPPTRSDVSQVVEEDIATDQNQGTATPAVSPPEGYPTDASLYNNSYMASQHSRGHSSPVSQDVTSPVSPNSFSAAQTIPQRRGTFDTLNTLPPSLQRAQSVEPSLRSQLQRQDSDWPTISPMVSQNSDPPRPVSPDSEGLNGQTQDGDANDGNLFHTHVRDGNSQGTTSLFQQQGPENGYGTWQPGPLTGNSPAQTPNYAQGPARPPPGTPTTWGHRPSPPNQFQEWPNTPTGPPAQYQSGNNNNFNAPPFQPPHQAYGRAFHSPHPSASTVPSPPPLYYPSSNPNPSIVPDAIDYGQSSHSRMHSQTNGIVGSQPPPLHRMLSTKKSGFLRGKTIRRTRQKEQVVAGSGSVRRRASRRYVPAKSGEGKAEGKREAKCILM